MRMGVSRSRSLGYLVRLHFSFFLRKKSFAYFSGFHWNSTIALRVETFWLSPYTYIYIYMYTHSPFAWKHSESTHHDFRRFSHTFMSPSMWFFCSKPWTSALPLPLSKTRKPWHCDDIYLLVFSDELRFFFDNHGPSLSKKEFFFDNGICSSF